MGGPEVVCRVGPDFREARNIVNQYRMPMGMRGGRQKKMRAAACCGRAVPRRGESESSPAPRYRTRAKRVGVHSLGLIVCQRAPRPKIHHNPIPIPIH